jgi:hypothetical protein
MSKLSKYIEENLAQRKAQKEKVLAGQAEMKPQSHPHQFYIDAGSMGNNHGTDNNTTYTGKG